jgi:type IV fimbrial biogenesis protein FimT
MRMPPPRHGLSLPELLVVLAILAILAGLAVPAFGALADAWGLRTAGSTVLAGLAEARMAALARGEEARLCPSLDGRSCAPEGMRGAGSLLVVTGEGAAAQVLRTAALAPRVELLANRPAATYYPWPRAASPVTLTLCAARRRSASLRVIVSQAGRPRVEPAGPC